jgi:hypothetical protein
MVVGVWRVVVELIPSTWDCNWGEGLTLRILLLEEGLEEEEAR